MASQSSELFLMGLFSVLDVIIEKPMMVALDMVRVSKEIRSALLERNGPFAGLYDFMLHYETASWQEVSRLMVVGDIEIDPVYEAYVEALKWFRNLFAPEEELKK
jgi:EAL and modified HD-GYP domain-containing signal transduction protein